jgi:hypothetical protein
MSSTLFQQACASWFDRIMRSGRPGRAQTAAYALKQCFNEVTHDAWPSQGWLSDRYAVSTKTIQRGVNDLVAGSDIGVTGSRRQRKPHRYTPHFLSVDWDSSDNKVGQACPGRQAQAVRQSSLVTPSTSPFSLTPAMIHKITLRHHALKSNGEIYNIMKRTRLEMLVATKLGRDGSNIIEKLHAFDDLCVDRLCVAEHYGALTGRLLKAARLAAKYL